VIQGFAAADIDFFIDGRSERGVTNSPTATEQMKRWGSGESVAHPQNNYEW